MNPDKQALIESLIEFGREATNKALVWGNSGNISHRLDENNFIITGSGAFLEKLHDRDFVTVDFKRDKHEGEAKPSLETRMHTEIYRTRKDVNAVFHSQPFFTTLISCTSLEVDSKLFPESMAYIDDIDRVPYYHPGSVELAEAVSEKVKDYDVLILSNHGAICAAGSLEGALLKTETLEMLCRLTVLSNIGDIELNFLSQDVKDDFLRHLKDVK